MYAGGVPSLHEMYFLFVLFCLHITLFADTCIIPLVDLKDIPTRVFNHRMDL